MGYFERERDRLFPAGQAGQRRAEAAGMPALWTGAGQDQRTTAMRQVAWDRAIHARESGAVLAALAQAGVPHLRWKGGVQAALWPWPELRPVGDLDLLVPADALEAGWVALEALGYRRAPGERDGRWRRGAGAVELLPPAGGRVVVDLHARPFRSVGHRLDVEGLLARAPLGREPGEAVPAPLDHALLVLVHAAKHGLVHPKWRLDVAAIADRYDPEVLLSAARPYRVERAVRAALGAVGAAGGGGVTTGLARVVMRRRSVEAARARGFRLPGAERYLLELVLEEGLRARARMGMGLIERLVDMGR